MRRRTHLFVALLCGLLGAQGTCQPVTPGQSTPSTTDEKAPPKFLMATHQPPDNMQGQWVRRIHAEAFRRLGVPIEMVQYPLQRMTEMLDRGELDGDVGRVLAHGDAHPQQVRVGEPMYHIEFGLFGISDDIALKRPEDLSARPLRVVHVRGVAICERLLRPHVAPENLDVVTTDEQGMNLLMMRRADLYCSADHTVYGRAARDGLRGAASPRLVLSMGRLPLYPYLARRHEALAPRLAAVLREMHHDGTIERLRLDSIAAVSRRRGD